MRLGMYAGSAIAAIGLSAGPASAKQYFFCYYWAGPNYESRTTVALTKIMEAEVDRIDDYRLERAWSNHASPGYTANSPYPGLRDASRSGQSSFRSGCLSSPRRAYLEDQIAKYYQPTYRYEPVEWTAIPADIVPRARASEGNVVEIAVPNAAPVAKPVTPPSSSRAQLVDTPTGKILMTPEKKAEYEAKLAEHQRLESERQRIIAENAAKHAANKAAAEARQAQHEQELAAHREMVAQMERDAAARRAAWATQSAAPTPAAPSTASGEMTVRRVASIGGGASEEAARNNLLNGFHKQFGPITNIRCSYIIFNGRREWTCTGDQAVRKVAPQSASGQ